MLSQAQVAGGNKGDAQQNKPEPAVTQHSEQLAAGDRVDQQTRQCKYAPGSFCQDAQGYGKPSQRNRLDALPALTFEISPKGQRIEQGEKEDECIVVAGSAGMPAHKERSRQ